MAGALQIKQGTKMRVAFDVPANQEPQFNMMSTFNKALDNPRFWCPYRCMKERLSFRMRIRRCCFGTERARSHR